MLTPLDKQFVTEYFVDFDPEAALKRCGDNSGHKLRAKGLRILAKPEVKDLMKTHQAAVAERAAISCAWVLDRFKEISDRCMQSTPVLIADGEGGQIESGEYKFDSSGAIKATEMIGKHLGFFEVDNAQSRPLVAIVGMNII